MRIRTSVVVFLVVAALAVPAGRAEAQAIPGPCHDGVLPGGALSRICVPAVGWNGSLVVFAHGYVAFNEPLGFQNLTLPDGTPIPMLIQALGFAFATTSYRQNGLAILEGVEDVRELVAAFRATVGPPLRTYMTGVSEGGAVTALLAERSPDLFTGALATCGPIGSFRDQINYFGDFRVLFDYYFPHVFPGSAIAIPPPVIANWEREYVPRIVSATAANPSATVELLTVAGVPFVAAQPATIAQSVIGVLWYNVHATNDARAKLGGNPFGNRGRWYSGSSNDVDLNRRVHRFVASPVALAALAPYETTGALAIPLVTLHTTGDEIIPFRHEVLYGAKAAPSGRGAFVPIPVNRYGHCNFTTGEVLTAFLGLLTIP